MIVRRNRAPSTGSDALTVADAAAAAYTPLDVARLYDFPADANGKQLPSSMQLVSGAIELRVEDVGATYPVVVDPLIATHQERHSYDAEHNAAARTQPRYCKELRMGQN